MKPMQPHKTSKVQEPAVIYGVARPSKGKAMETGEVVDRIQGGLPMVEFEALRQMLGLGAEELAEFLSISRSTLARRRKAGNLDPLESDRLIRYARLYALASDILKSGDAAKKWLNAPARAFNFVRPLEFARTETGAREVEALLGRIEFGVFS